MFKELYYFGRTCFAHLFQLVASKLVTYSPLEVVEVLFLSAMERSDVVERFALFPLVVGTLIIVILVVGKIDVAV